MADSNYVRNYFSDYASEWLANAYNLEEFPVRYPTGLNRVRISLQILADHIKGSGKIVDLGCGGGELCIEAAKIGLDALGVDVAPGMIEQANQLKGKQEQGTAGKLHFQLGDAVDTKLESGSFDAVVGMGLIEYLPEDDKLLAEAFRLLKPGGVFLVSCRNKLFNLTSANDYTKKELERGTIAALLDDAVERLSGEISPKVLEGFVDRLEEALPRMRGALALDLGEAEKKHLKPPFTEERRQHAPAQLWEAARQNGFSSSKFVGVNPHPLRLEFKFIAPRFFAQFARAYESLEETQSSLMWSSAFIGVFEKPA
jgi:SAM-dependent methyltransferase